MGRKKKMEGTKKTNVGRWIEYRGREKGWKSEKRRQEGGRIGREGETGRGTRKNPGIYAERAKYSPPRLHSASDYGVALGEKHALPLAEGLIWRC
jgi:hypothetical protein